MAENLTDRPFALARAPIQFRASRACCDRSDEFRTTPEPFE